MTTAAALGVGLHPGVPAQVYRDIDAVNQSTLKKADRSWAHYRQAEQFPDDEPTDSKALGTVLHALVLEPHRVNEIVAVAPKVNRRTNAGKDEWAAFEVDAESKGLTVVDDETMDDARAMARAIQSHPEAAKIIRCAGVCESVAIWDDPKTGIRCKSRIDKFVRSRLLVDLKTSRDASPEGFRRSVLQFRYDIQAAFYETGFEHAAGERQEMVFVVVESAPPYPVMVYTLDEPAVRIGRATVRRLLDELKVCRERDRWPAYPGGVQVTGLPHWYVSRAEREMPSQIEEMAL